MTKEYFSFKLKSLEEELEFYDRLIEYEEKRIDGFPQKNTDPFLIKYKKDMEEAKKGQEELRNKIKELKNKLA